MDNYWKQTSGEYHPFPEKANVMRLRHTDPRQGYLAFVITIVTVPNSNLGSLPRQALCRAHPKVTRRNQLALNKHAWCRYS